MILSDERGRPVILPITQQGRDIAQQFEQLHVTANPLTPQRGEQIRLNTLAVWVMHDYFTLLDIPTNLTRSDSWNPLMQLAGNMADLDIEGLGKMECRPIQAHEERCFVPPEVWTSRVGYVVVEISENQKQAKVLGFRPTVETEMVSVHDLRPLEDLIDHLQDVRQTAQTVSEGVASPQMVSSAPDLKREQVSQVVHLNQWLQGLFEAGWQHIDQILTPDRLATAYAFRTAQTSSLANGSAMEAGAKGERIERAKWIDLGIQLGQGSVALVVQLQQEPEQKTDVTIQLYPGPGEAILPAGMALQILDEAGEIFSQTQAREADNLVQLKFRGDRDEAFQIAVELGDVKVVESFIL